MALDSLGNLRPQFVLKDHLGNSRVIFSDTDENGSISDDEVGQVNHYYPFGLEMEGPWQKKNKLDYAYLYNGKERQDELGLGYYAYGVRFYDPGIGRFVGVDPISDAFPHVSPYNYAFNNPLF